jgi:hypothetical protein
LFGDWDNNSTAFLACGLGLGLSLAVDGAADLVIETTDRGADVVGDGGALGVVVFSAPAAASFERAGDDGLWSSFVAGKCDSRLADGVGYSEGSRSRGKREGKGVLHVNVMEGITWPPFREGPIWDPRCQELGTLSIVV